MVATAPAIAAFCLCRKPGTADKKPDLPGILFKYGKRRLARQPLEMGCPRCEWSIHTDKKEPASSSDAGSHAEGVIA
jgi:hypothetical protein